MFKKIAGVVVAVPALVGQAYAAVPEGVTAAIAETKTDSVTVAGLMIGIAAALLLFVYIRKVMK